MHLRALVLVLVALALAAPALAQTPAQPITGSYEDVYVVSGRALGSDGRPMAQAMVIIELDQKNVQAEPLRAAANCKGDFIASFNLKHVDPAGKVHLNLYGPTGNEIVGRETLPLDPFYRRSDAVLHAEGEWPYTCAREANVWDVSASVSIRLLNRTEPYDRDGQEVHARPYSGIVRLRYEAPGGNVVCPPHPMSPDPDQCEIFNADPRGDIRYTFTLDEPFQGGGRVDVILQDNTTLDVPIDPVSRLGFAYHEVTGQGVPEELYETPAAGLISLVVAGTAAFAVRRLFRPRSR